MDLCCLCLQPRDDVLHHVLHCTGGCYGKYSKRWALMRFHCFAAVRECLECAETCLSSEYDCQNPSGTSDVEKDWALSIAYRISSPAGSTKCSLFT